MSSPIEICLYDARYNYKRPTTYLELSKDTGYTISTLRSIKCLGVELKKIPFNYIIDKDTPRKQLREWYEAVEFEDEEWKWIEDTNYMVSNHGRVKNMKFKKYPEGRLIMPRPTHESDKTFRALLRVKGGKRVDFYIARLVAKYFIENKNNLPYCKHKTYRVYDNYYKNIEYCTKEQKIKFHTEISNHSRYIASKIVIIDADKKELVDYAYTQIDIAEILKCSKETVCKHMKGGYTRCIPKNYIIKYEKDLTFKEQKIVAAADI